MFSKYSAPLELNRRSFLKKAGMGFGGLALASLLQEKAYAGSHIYHGTHHTAKAKSIIFLYMDGGVSQVDSFDPKPMLKKHDGKDPAKFFKVQPTQFNNNGTILGSPWEFKKHGKSGLEISSLFPNIAKHADEMCIFRSMTSKFPEHTFANYFLHTGSGLQGRPSMGAWANYGLGSECENLPGFIVLNGGLIPPGGLDNFNSGFLPASLQGSIFLPQEEAVANILPHNEAMASQKKKLALLKELDEMTVKKQGSHDKLESAIKNYELAYNMQMAVPELMDISNEPEYLKESYGLNHKNNFTQTYGRQCLTARKLVERGVRFIELTCPATNGNDRWDAHGNLIKNHNQNALAVDQPIGALISDLKQRGLLDETLIVFASEFGRTPFAQGRDGRDHHPMAYSVWMAGGGIKGGTTYGTTDEFGYQILEGKMEMYDMHATMLHLLGIDHEKSTFRFSGRDMRLTDVHGHVIHNVIN